MYKGEALSFASRLLILINKEVGSWSYDHMIFFAELRSYYRFSIPYIRRNSVLVETEMYGNENLTSIIM